jgi:predicted RND superfamily exporter protein
MHKFSKGICKHRKIILIISLILLIPALIGMKATRINYDILVYLPNNVETIKGENILSEEFNMGAFSVIIVENMQTKELLKLEKEIKKVDNVEKVISIADVIGTSIPVDMLPEDLKENIYKDDKTIMLVTFKEQISADRTIQSVETLRKITDERCKISGMTSTVLDTRDLSNSEVIIYIVIAVLLCLIVLEIALDSYIAPILLLFNIGIAILYNMGTNIFLGEISYITKAISAVLQLGVTMDFAIFLYHSYMQEKKSISDNNEAMANAITKTLLSVVGSSLTTIARFPCTLLYEPHFREGYWSCYGKRCNMPE